MWLRFEVMVDLECHRRTKKEDESKALQPTQKLKANLANPTIRRFLIHYFEL